MLALLPWKLVLHNISSMGIHYFPDTSALTPGYATCPQAYAYISGKSPPVMLHI